MICRANQWTAFYTIGTCVMKEWKVSQSWVDKIFHHQIYKHQSFTGALVFPILFGIHYNFFHCFTYLFDCKFVDLMVFLFHKTKFGHPKYRAHLRSLARLSVPDRHRARNLSRPVTAISNETTNELTIYVETSQYLTDDRAYSRK